MPNGRDDGNFISEWFGHRVYPVVVGTQQSIADQTARRCPFLSVVKEQDQECVKKASSKGVCTISSCSNGSRQDWLACPYRAFDPDLVRAIAGRIFAAGDLERFHVYPAPNLAKPEIRERLENFLRGGERLLIYFDVKLGGEISLQPTAQSPEMAFDVTMVEIEARGNALALGKFAILEIQTMDFHGSYRYAVNNLFDGLRLHQGGFPSALQAHLQWLGEGIEGPNIANVFKRTFYQIMFKFGFGYAESCAGTALAVPEAVWDSWQRFLGRPQLQDAGDGTTKLRAPNTEEPSKIPAWIYVFDFDAGATVTPSPIRVKKIISVTPDALSYYALGQAPRAASMQLNSDTGIYATLRRRLQEYWPDHPLV